MPVELRPTWCLSDEQVAEVIDVEEWLDAEGSRVLDQDGDDWCPGRGLVLSRRLSLRLEPVEARRRLGLMAGQALGVGARWSCRATSVAGVHRGGPSPVRLIGEDVVVTVDVPASIARSVELETCLVVDWTIDNRPAGSCPSGALVWSDGWSQPVRERTILLEGEEGRIPVRTVSFNQHFGEPSGALWSIDLDTSISSDDLVANVVTVLLNKDVLVRDFPGTDGEADASRLPEFAIAGISTDLVRSLTQVLVDELVELDNAELGDGSVGALLAGHLTETFGSVSLAASTFESDPTTFAREAWNRFAPNKWGAAR